MAGFDKLLKPTKRAWVIATGTILGLIAVVTLEDRVSEWVRNARERRYEEDVVGVTPDRLIERCGMPAEDVTREMYPILVRTISYQPKRNQTLKLEFSRTAEEKSDWVFLAMQDESGAWRYDTPEARVTALSCLDSKK